MATLSGQRLSLPQQAEEFICTSYCYDAQASSTWPISLGPGINTCYSAYNLSYSCSSRVLKFDVIELIIVAVAAVVLIEFVVYYANLPPQQLNYYQSDPRVDPWMRGHASILSGEGTIG